LESSSRQVAIIYTTLFIIISYAYQEVNSKFSEVLKIGALYKKYLYILCKLYIAIRKKVCYNIDTGKEGISQCTTKYRLSEEKDLNNSML